MAERAKEISLDMYVTANSPGEISGWVVPVLREIRAKLWQCRITLVILPCQYASGEELSLGARSGADRCVGLKSLSKLLSDPEEKKFDVKKRLLLHLGGDMFFSVCLSKKIGAPLWAYSPRPRWKFFVDRYFAPDDAAAERFKKAGVKPEKFHRIGNIALDSVHLIETEEETREFLGLPSDAPVLSCLTGSRPIEYTEGIRLFAAVAGMVAEKIPNLRVLFPLAPTVREDLLQTALAIAGIAWFGEARVREIDIGGGRRATVVRDRTLEALNCSKLAIAVPGTNNLQAAALYLPYIMALPLDRADEFPLDGLAGNIPLWLPGVRAIKKALIVRKNERTSFVSLPNKIARRMIAPEIRGFFEPKVVARMAIGLLESPEKLKEMSRAFWELTHERGAAALLAGHVEKFAKEVMR
ncbi:MAG: hypothetical protein LBQ36_04060 [Synergistaceae bacterium]|jgi:lipid-A-disaccharide synthase|nr:hypothetical protein [Synergistaceae bacterium]